VIAAAVHLPVFRNEHLSVSRLRRFEECPLAFHHQYVDPDAAGGQARGEPAEFGTVLHAALESTYQWVVGEEYEGPFPEGELLEHFRHAWSESGLTGVALYQEGRALLREYARWVGSVDHMRVLAVEREFNLLVGPACCRLVEAGEKAAWRAVDDHFVVNGFIDRVDRLDAETVEVVDYKSGRLLFSREELASDLQMSVYALVAQRLYPWAKTVRLAFHMLRHGLVQRAERTDEDLAAARGYVLSLGARTERGPYGARLNTHCGGCGYRDRCETYKSAVTSKLAVVATSRSDLETVAAERERVAKIAKAAYARKEELDAVLRAAIGESDSVELGGVVYRLQQFMDTEYPVPELLALFREVGVDLTAAMRIDSTALDAVLTEVEKDAGLPRTVRDLLRVRVAAKAIRVPQKPRLDARPKKK
jgi:putative RecB family exonuclease